MCVGGGRIGGQMNKEGECSFSHRGLLSAENPREYKRGSLQDAGEAVLRLAPSALPHPADPVRPRKESGPETKSIIAPTTDRETGTNVGRGRRPRSRGLEEAPKGSRTTGGGGNVPTVVTKSTDLPSLCPEAALRRKRPRPSSLKHLSS